MIKKIFFLLFPILIFSQSHLDPDENYVSEKDKKTFHKEFVEILSKPALNMDELYEISKELLKASKTDKERARSYSLMGDAMRKKMRYSEAIDFFKKADFYAQKSNFDNERFMINLILSNLYSIIGLHNHAKNTLDIAAKITNKINDPDDHAYMLSMLDYQRSNNFKNEKKYCEASDYNLRVSNYNRQKYEMDDSGNNKYNYQANLCIYAYNLLKCGDFAAAKKVVENFEQIFNIATDYQQSYLLEYYYLDKAMLYDHENNKKEAKIWFDKAIDRSKKVKKTASLALIIEERLHRDIGDSKSEKKYFEEFLVLYRLGQQEAASVFLREINAHEKNTAKERKSVNILAASFIVLTGGLLFILYYNARRKKQIKTNFAEIIKKLEQQNLRSGETDQETDEPDIPANTENESSEKKQMVISDQKEVELLQKLKKFESGKEFTSPNFTSSNLATILDTNIKYTNYILKKHREKNFNVYINGLRINYLIHLLYKDPRYLDYKINYLSEIVGFSSHSHFTQVFKKQLNISPSEFISRLSRDKPTV